MCVSFLNLISQQKLRSWVDAIRLFAPPSSLAAYSDISDDDFLDAEGKQNDQQLNWMPMVGMGPNAVLNDVHIRKNLGNREMDRNCDWHEFALSIPEKVDTAAFLNKAKKILLTAVVNESLIAKQQLNDNQKKPLV